MNFDLGDDEEGMTIHEKLDILISGVNYDSVVIPRIQFFGTYQGQPSYFYFPSNAKKVTFTIDPSSNQNGGSVLNIKSTGSGTIASNIYTSKTYSYDLPENSYFEYACGSSYIMILTNIIIDF